jgi:hypothetical protein
MRERTLLPGSGEVVVDQFRQCSGWHCGFTTESRKKLPKEFSINSSLTVRELASRGNGLVDKWDREGLELGLEISKGGIWLRLSDEQCRAIGGML